MGFLTAPKNTISGRCVQPMPCPGLFAFPGWGFYFPRQTIHTCKRADPHLVQELGLNQIKILSNPNGMTHLRL